MNERDPTHWQGLLKAASKEEKPRLFEQALEVWPNSTELWLGYVNTGETPEQKGKLLAKALPESVDPRLYEEYISYVKQTEPENLANAYEYALNVVSFDPQSGSLWKAYIDFLGTEPVSNEWEEQFRRDRVRKAFKRAVTIPLINIEQLWRSYSTFENRISRVSARKFIDERSGAYMKARGALKSWQAIMGGLSFSTMPSPEESEAAAPVWRKLIEWERGNPLELESDEELKTRVEQICKRATHSARWSAVIWFDAGLYAKEEYWEAGSEAMPESMLLAFKSAESFELQDDLEGVRRVLKRLADNLVEVKEDPTPAYAELVRSTHRMRGLEAARRCVAESLPAEPGPALYIAAASLESADPARERSVWSLAYRKFGRQSPDFLVLYLTYLFEKMDIANARAVFEQTADLKIRKVWDTMLALESKYIQSASTSVGALKNLETRYLAEFKDIDVVELFIQRYVAFSSTLPKQIDSNGAATLSASGVAVTSAVSEPAESVRNLLSMLPPANIYDGPQINTDLLTQLLLRAV